MSFASTSRVSPASGVHRVVVVMPSALGPGGRHHELINKADATLERERRRVEETRAFIREVRRAQFAVEDFNASQERQRRRRRQVRDG